MKTEEKNAALQIIEAAAADLGVDPIARDSQAPLVGYLAGMVVRLNEDKARLNYVGELIRHCPHTEFYWTDDEDDEKPLGFSIENSGCDPIFVCADEWRDVIDAHRSEAEARS